MKLNDIMKFEKENMNKIRYITNYRIVPAYAGLVMVCLAIVGILMEMDETRYTPTAIGIFVFIGVVTIGLLSATPLVRKKEIEAEMNRYDFDIAGVEAKNIYDFSGDEVSFRFDKNGMYINEDFFLV